MAEQQDGLEAGVAGEIDLEMVAEIGGVMEFGLVRQALANFAATASGNAIDRGFVVAGRFDLDELANRRDDLVLMLREIAQAIGPCGLRLSRC